MLSFDLAARKAALVAKFPPSDGSKGDNRWQAEQEYRGKSGSCQAFFHETHGRKVVFVMAEKISVIGAEDAAKLAVFAICRTCDSTGAEDLRVVIADREKWQEKSCRARVDWLGYKVSVILPTSQWDANKKSWLVTGAPSEPNAFRDLMQDRGFVWDASFQEFVDSSVLADLLPAANPDALPEDSAGATNQGSSLAMAAAYGGKDNAREAQVRAIAALEEQLSQVNKRKAACENRCEELRLPLMPLVESLWNAKGARSQVRKLGAFVSPRFEVNSAVDAYLQNESRGLVDECCARMLAATLEAALGLAAAADDALNAKREAQPKWLFPWRKVSKQKSAELAALQVVKDEADAHVNVRQEAVEAHGSLRSAKGAKAAKLLRDHQLAAVAGRRKEIASQLMSAHAQRRDALEWVHDERIQLAEQTAVLLERRANAEAPKLLALETEFKSVERERDESQKLAVALGVQVRSAQERLALVDLRMQSGLSYSQADEALQAESQREIVEERSQSRQRGRDYGARSR